MDRIRVSVGSAAVLGLRPLKMLHKPTTIHLLQYSPIGCKANCSFCPQARDSKMDKKQLSRVSWPDFPWTEVKDGITSRHAEKAFSRVCLQTVLYPNYINDMFKIVKDLLIGTNILLSIALIPVKKNVLVDLNELGVDRIGVAIDAATPALFSKIKGEEAGCAYTWNDHWRALQDALSVFGKQRVSTHFIAGLGETEHDLVDRMQDVHDLGITIGLFAFTAVPGTRLGSMKSPGLKSYRKMQLARYLIVNGFGRSNSFSYDERTGEIVSWNMDDDILKRMIVEKKGKMFETSGCPGCNRPYYNESTRGPMYNHPASLNDEQVNDALDLIFSD